MSDEEKHKKMISFMDKHEKDIKKYGMMKDYNSRFVCLFVRAVCLFTVVFCLFVVFKEINDVFR